jgi:hypothetical protein
MKIQFCRLANVFCVSLLLGLIHASVHAEPQFLLQVTFKKVDSIQTGSLANYTDTDQSIRFIVFPTKLINLETHEDLFSNPFETTVLAVENSAFRSKNNPADSTQYCIDIIRSIAFNPNVGAELSLFLRVTHITATNFVVHKFDSCALQLPSQFSHSRTP